MAHTKAQIMPELLENNSNSLAGIHQWAERAVLQAEGQNDKEIRLRFQLNAQNLKKV